MVDFTKRKFLAFPSEMQHKKCAEILRSAYSLTLEGNNAIPLLESYHEIARWMEFPPVAVINLKSISDRYHEHLKLALTKHKEHNLLPAVRRGDRIQAEAAWPLAVYFDQIRSAHNVGSIIRTMEAFSMGKAYFSKNTPFANEKQVQDSAMGACQWVECNDTVPLESLPRPLIALETSSSAIPLFDFIFPEVFTLIVGNEEYGCSDHSLMLADILVEIPMRGHKNSLNVANAFAIAAAEIYRQRHGK